MFFYSLKMMMAKNIVERLRWKRRREGSNGRKRRNERKEEEKRDTHWILSLGYVEPTNSFLSLFFPTFISFFSLHFLSLSHSLSSFSFPHLLPVELWIVMGRWSRHGNAHYSLPSSLISVSFAHSLLSYSSSSSLFLSIFSFFSLIRSLFFQ